MRGVLIVAHGSRAPKTREFVDAAAAGVRARLPGRAVETAYMNFLRPGIREGLNLLAQKGVKSICVAPYFLFEGKHLNRDIPAEIAAFAAGHPEIAVTQCGPLGDDGRLADILTERIIGAEIDADFKGGDCGE